jgi:hypothetical protein
MGNPSRNTYRRGDWLADCDRCGFTYYASELKTEWQGLKVCSVCHEERHPQDLLRIPRTERPVPWTRPPQYITVDVPGWTETVVDGTAKTVTFGPVDPDSL